MSKKRKKNQDKVNPLGSEHLEMMRQGCHPKAQSWGNKHKDQKRKRKHNKPSVKQISDV